MLDLLLRGGSVITGTGAPARRSDVGIKDGRIVVVGDTDDPASRVTDVGGLVVAPGFIDIHTHYDAQMLWDPAASPSSLHGVTTVIGGNCGFSIAPLGEGDAEYIMQMMARVEGMPIEALKSGPAWDWRSFGEWLDRLDGNVAVNAGFLAGHSTLRRVVMGDAAVGSAATDTQIETMVRLLHEALAGGALGLSSSLGDAHTDGDGQPVPSRAALRAEFLALAASLRDHAGTSLEFIPAVGEIPQERMELMADMSLAANRPLNWNLLGSMSPIEIYEQQLAACDLATARGAVVVALALPDVMKLRASRILDDMPGWKEVAAMSDGERRSAVRDPAVRERLRQGAETARASGLGAVASFDLIEVAEASDASLVGRTVAAIAEDRQMDGIDVLIDLVLPDRLPLTLVLPTLVPSLGNTDEGWVARAEVWRDPRVVLGGSDAGAHLDIMCHANYPTVVLGEAVRERGLLSLEEAVRLMTDVPARLYGLRGRGRVEEGWYADLVVFDPDRVGSEPAVTRRDLPGGGYRLYAEAAGVEQVLVGGIPVVVEGALSGNASGTVLRSGVDTETVTVPGG